MMVVGRRSSPFKMVPFQRTCHFRGGKPTWDPLVSQLLRPLISWGKSTLKATRLLDFFSGLFKMGYYYRETLRINPPWNQHSTWKWMVGRLYFQGTKTSALSITSTILRTPWPLFLAARNTNRSTAEHWSATAQNGGRWWRRVFRPCKGNGGSPATTSYCQWQHEMSIGSQAWHGGL